MYTYTIDNLFNCKEVAGCRLERFINANKHEKSKICTGTGISRAELDKVLNGEVTSKTNFDKYILKLLEFFDLTPDVLMGGVDNPYTNQKQLRKALNIDLEHLNQKSGVSVEELGKIEAGENVPLAKLRDVALCLGTGVRGVLGDGYFQTQIAHMGCYVENDPTTIRSPGGFWGHLGILVKGHPKFIWFPITMYTRNMIYQNSKVEYMVVPCMDNSLLLINCKNIEELVLLDEDCNQPADMDWDCKVSCGEVPAVVYEAFDDYMSCKYSKGKPDKYDISGTLLAALDGFVAKQELEPETFEYELNSVTVMLASGRTIKHGIYCGNNSNLTLMVKCIYETGELMGETVVTFEDGNEAEILINIENVSMIKLPLAMIDDMITEECKEMISEQAK